MLIYPHSKLQFYSKHGRSDGQAHLLVASNYIIDLANKIRPQNQLVSGASPSVSTPSQYAEPDKQPESSVWSCFKQFSRKTLPQIHVRKVIQLTLR